MSYVRPSVDKLHRQIGRPISDFVDVVSLAARDSAIIVQKPMVFRMLQCSLHCRQGLPTIVQSIQVGEMQRCPNLLGAEWNRMLRMMSALRAGPRSTPRGNGSSLSIVTSSTVLLQCAGQAVCDADAVSNITLPTIEGKDEPMEAVVFEKRPS